MTTTRKELEAAVSAAEDAGEPSLSRGGERTAELNEPITMPDEDRCETSQADLDAAEIARLRAALLQAGTLANKRGEQIAELLAANNRANAAEKLLVPSMNLEWRGFNLYLMVGAWEAMVANINPPARTAQVTGRSPADLFGVTTPEAFDRIAALLAIEGLTVPALPVQP